MDKGLGSADLAAQFISNSMIGKNYLITIGIDKYTGAGGFGELESCVKDCGDLIKVLKEKYAFEDQYCKPNDESSGSFEIPIELGSLRNEKATKEHIKDLLGIFIHNNEGKMPVSNSMDNLIIYFSGHGYLHTSPNGQKKACWVPYLTKDPKGIGDYFSMQELIDLLIEMDFRHILVIVDSCHSGGLFDVPTYYKLPVNGDATKSIEDLPSRWAICSSRKNENSLAGQNGKGSKFTEILVDKLMNNEQYNLSLKSLIASVESEFDKDESDTNKTHRPLSNSLNIIGDNIGQFIFKARKNEIEKLLRKKHLEIVIHDLNYIHQQNEFYNFENKNFAIAIFSGTKDCGLRYIIDKAKNSTFIPENIYPSNGISAARIEGRGDERALNIFKNALGWETLTREQTQNKIVGLLENENLIIELSFFFEEDDTLFVRPQDKKEILEDIAKFLSFLNKEVNRGKLFIFLIDETRFNYGPFVNKGKVFDADVIPFPLISQLTTNDLRTWYNSSRTSYQSKPIVQREFDTLFKDKIFKSANLIIDETNGYPGLVIRRICEDSGCDEIAVNLKLK